MTTDLAERIKDSDVVLFDGTLWENEEMATSKVGEKTGQSMGHMNNSGKDGSIQAFKDLGVKRKIFIHINTTNPILLEDSKERKIVEEIAKLLAKSEYKRFQSAPGPKVTSKAFGRDRRFPLTSGFKNWD